jgi:hypothetical protein
MSSWRYCVDTSALIDLNYLYPRSVFPTLWRNMDILVEGDRLIAPSDVLEELKRGDDDLTGWAKKQKRMFRPQNAELLREVSEILKVVPDLADPDRIRPVHADPFVVALARIEHQRAQTELLSAGCAVVCHEGRGKLRLRIPDACDRFGIECLRFQALFAREGWSF